MLALVVLDVAAWNTIRISIAAIWATPAIYFLPVTQGESALLVLPNDVTVLTDAGADDGIVDDLEKAMPAGSSDYIDLAIISYPQPADYEGYIYLLQHYQIGAFAYNGRADGAHSVEWAQLLAAIAAKHIPLITLGAGDRIRYGTGARGDGAEIDILSPDGAFVRSPEPEDTAIVQRIVTSKFSALLTADIGVNVEDVLLARGDVRADILKAPFPGVAGATGDPFLHAVAPRVIVVMPGIKNTASAPTKALLARLASSTNAAIVSPKPGSFLLYNK